VPPYFFSSKVVVSHGHQHQLLALRIGIDGDDEPELELGLEFKLNLQLKCPSPLLNLTMEKRPSLSSTFLVKIRSIPTTWL
jgi:hypothetical protein